MADPAQPPVNPVNYNVDGQNVPIHNAQAVQGADGGINQKVEQTKLPEFWGRKEKDSIASNEFIKRIDNMPWPSGALPTPGWNLKQRSRISLVTAEPGPSFDHCSKRNL
jgi:hypothetical protein